MGLCADCPRIGASSSPEHLCVGHPRTWRKCIAVVSNFEKIKTGLEEAIAYEQVRGPANVSVRALEESQEAFRGVAEELGIETEEDIVAMVKEVRAERSREKAE